MASKPDDKGILSTRHTARLAPVITDTDMETIALGYLGIKEEIVKQLRQENKGQSEAFNRAVLINWKNMNSGNDQVKVGEKESKTIHITFTLSHLK